MGADTKALRTRIKSVRSTMHLTKAMGLVASSKIRRANEAMHKAADYAGALSDMTAALSGMRQEPLSAADRRPYPADRDRRRPGSGGGL